MVIVKPQKRHRKAIIWLLATGKTPQEVAQVTHTSNNLDLPEGIDLIYSPAYLLNCNCSVRVWALASEIVANTSSTSLDKLEALLVLRCQELMKQYDLISGLTCYHWWPKTRAA